MILKINSKTSFWDREHRQIKIPLNPLVPTKETTGSTFGFFRVLIKESTGSMSGDFPSVGFNLNVSL